MFQFTVVESALPEISNRVMSLKTADQHLKQMSNNFSTVIRAMAPRDTGWMVSTASEVVKIRDGYAVGPFDKLGKPRSRAPRGTIRKFLEDYPEYAFRSKSRTGKSRAKRRRAFPGAWHFLSSDAKRKLRELRRAGAYGMDGPSPRYWQAIQELRVPGNGGAMGGRDFLTDAYATAYIFAAILQKNVFGR